jgi:hypothetical protein
LLLDKLDGGGELGHIRNSKRWKKKAHEDYIWLVMRLAICTLQIKYIRPGSGWKQTKCIPLCMPGSSFMHIVDISE